MPKANPQENDLGRYLKLLRIKNSLTMMQTADLTGITQGYISQIENGIYSPSAKTLAKLARAYKVPEIQLLRKAGIVQMSSSAPGVDDLDSQFMTNLFESDTLLDLTDSRGLAELLRRGLASLEYLSDQIRQRRQVASLASAPLNALRGDFMVGEEMMLQVYDAAWQPFANALGEPAAMRLPAALCAGDPDAFVLSVADNSMTPLIHTGDWVVISPATELGTGQVVAINDRNQIQLRNYTAVNGMLALTPLNPEFAAKALLIDLMRDKVEIVGRVLRLVNREL